MLHQRLSFLFAFVLIGLICTRCTETEFDTPPVNGNKVVIDEDLIIPISTLLDSLHTGANEEVDQIESFKDKYIRGIVAADDESGNFYKSFIIQDEGAGIQVLVNRTDSYPFYSQDREIFVKLDGLIVGDFRGVAQLGGFINGEGQLSEIVNDSETIIPSSRDEFLEPNTLEINQLNDNQINTLIKLEDVEFAIGQSNLTYADAVNLSTENRILVDCNGNQITVRTSGFATFANDPLPQGNGEIIGIYSIYESGSTVTKQLYIRDVKEVELNNPKCESSVREEIQENFDDYNSNDVISISGWSNIAVQGSNQWSVNLHNNVTSAKMTGFQSSGSDGSVESWLITPPVSLEAPQFLRFTSAYALGEHNGLEVFISTDFNGSNPNTATWTNLNPTIATIENNDWNDYVDSDKIDISSFGDEGYIAWKYTGTNLDESNTNWFVDDIEISENPTGNTGGEDCGSGEILSEDFQNSNLENYADFSDDFWSNMTIKGDEPWQFRTYSGNNEIRCSAFEANNEEIETWLISNEIDFSTPRTICFQSAHAFYEHNGLSLHYSDDYTDGNPNDATWTEVPANYAPSSLVNYEVHDSGVVDLSTFNNSNGRLAFRYQGTSSSNTTTWIIDNILISTK